LARQLSATGHELTFDRGDGLQIVYRRIDSGLLTPWLATLRAGDEVTISAPYGEFTVRDPARPLIFIATGTGIAPARAYLRSYPGLDLTVIHGVRAAADLFYRSEFEPERYFPCVSGEEGTGWHGRVTDFCAQRPMPADAHYYLCGANVMFYDMRDLLAARGVPYEHVFTEAYYYQDEC
jgi:ferredoxin-NADP reductase